MLIDGLNEEFSNIAASYLKVGDESTSAMRFCTTSKRDLPNLSYIFRKPELIDNEFKKVA